MWAGTSVGPPLTAVNASLHKVFRFTERMNLDFSANATNVINHPSFAIPDKNIGTGPRRAHLRHQRRRARDGTGREVQVLKAG